MRNLGMKDILLLTIIILVGAWLRSWYISSVYPPELWIAPKISLAQHGFLVIDPVSTPVTSIQLLTNHYSRYFLTPTIMRLFLPFIKGPWGIIDVLLIVLVVALMTRNKYAVYTASALASFGPLGFVYTGMNLDSGMLAYLAYPLMFYMTYLMNQNPAKKRRYMFTFLVLFLWVLLTYQTAAVGLLFVFVGIIIGYLILKVISSTQRSSFKIHDFMPRIGFLAILSVFAFYYLITWGDMWSSFSGILSILRVNGFSFFQSVFSSQVPSRLIWHDSTFRLLYSIQLIIYALITAFCFMLILRDCLKQRKIDATDTVLVTWTCGFAAFAVGLLMVGMLDRLAEHMVFLTCILVAFTVTKLETRRNADKGKKNGYLLNLSRRHIQIITATLIFIILILSIGCLQAPKLQRVIFSPFEKEANEWIGSNVPENQTIFTDFRFAAAIFTYANHSASQSPYNEQDPSILSIFYPTNITEAWLFCRQQDFSFIVFTRTMWSNHVVTFNIETIPISQSTIQEYLNSQYFVLKYRNPDVIIFAPV